MFRISLDALLILDAIDRLGSFAAAGNELFKVPSTISYTVNKLEQDLDVKLFERFGPKVTITKAGNELLKEGRHLLKAATDLEHRVRRVACGWETELAIGMDSIFSPSALMTEVADFYKVSDLTRLKFSQEAMSGTWEALLDRRVDLLIGAVGEGPSGGGYNTYLMGSIEFVFVVAPQHALAEIERPITKSDLANHLAISVSDSVRKLPPRTVGLLFGQNTLALPNMQAKYDYQMAGVGFGFLPEPMVRNAIKNNLLIVKQVEEPRKPESVYMAWRPDEAGAGLTWWINRIKSVSVMERLWGGLNNTSL